MFTTTRRLPTACVAIDLNTDDCLVTQLIQRCMIFPLYIRKSKNKKYPNLLKPNLSYGRVDW